MRKTTYITPCISIQPIYHSSVLCASGGRSATSNIDVHSDGKSGDQAAAF